MTLSTRLIARWAGLGPVRHEQVDVDRDLATPMPDGTVLLADRWYPVGVDRPPAVIVRTPYGRRQLGSLGRLFAERGYSALIQSCRGGFGSGGAWVPFRHERADGMATHEWISQQPWFGGRSATFGASYMGLTQWAVMQDAPPHLAAMALDVTASRFRDAATFPGGSFSLETGATWLRQLEYQEVNPRRILWAQARRATHLAPVYRVLPLTQADRAGLGRHVGFYQDWLSHERPADPWWDPVDFGRDLTHAPPATLVGGWYDMFLPWQIDDYVALRAAGRQARLTVGPWTHTSLRGLAAQLRDGLEWFDEHLRGAPPAADRGEVRLFVMGADRWVDLDQWPPPATVQRWYLRAGGGLSPAAADVGSAGSASPDTYVYDPADPTPGLGGPSLNWRTSGRQDQAQREGRADVLTYTSTPLDLDMTVAGPLRGQIWIRSTTPHTDVFVRLCDVDPGGRSHNLSDGIIRLEPDAPPAGPDGTRCVDVAMWPTTATFRRGHRMRLQVSSGAHPLFVRNLGSGERLGSGTTLVVAHQEIHHDATHPSAIDLPVSPI